MMVLVRCHTTSPTEPQMPASASMQTDATAQMMPMSRVPRLKIMVVLFCGTSGTTQSSGVK